MRWRMMAAACLVFGAGAGAQAAEIAIACSSLGQEYEICRQGVDAWARQSGHSVKIVSTPNSATDRLGLFQQLLAAGAGDVDGVPIHGGWSGLLGRHLLDLAPKAGGVVGEHFPAP